MIHVAGTNGKGSVCLKLAHALRARGLRVGLYTSPHISSFRERIMINDDAISEQSVVDIGAPILAACRQTNIPATFFELTTLIALTYFERSNVDVAVIEVGLGYRFFSFPPPAYYLPYTLSCVSHSGRGDSTNIITPCLSIITSIGSYP
jgi:dihydrofolate synthase/folylpolyglutamate synthase